ncbi:hypothetical protein [Actinomyces vulturis]|uniref:hypothetical protein n=1 Tax=Actinomyces vulturis TaxID=1857645 RepID=UPI00083292B5|nr:hypothetical protein [Actinomyces vulturis]
MTDTWMSNNNIYTEMQPETVVDEPVVEEKPKPKRRKRTATTRRSSSKKISAEVVTEVLYVHSFIENMDSAARNAFSSLFGTDNTESLTIEVLTSNKKNDLSDMFIIFDQDEADRALHVLALRVETNGKARMKSLFDTMSKAGFINEKMGSSPVEAARQIANAITENAESIKVMREALSE